MQILANIDGASDDEVIMQASSISSMVRLGGFFLYWMLHKLRQHASWILKRYQVFRQKFENFSKDTKFCLSFSFCDYRCIT